MKKYILLLFVIFLITGCKNERESKINIVAINFPSYDFARAITKNSTDVKVQMLVKPGEEIHTYEPTPKDIINVKKSDLLIYTGGESDEWVEDIIEDKKNTIKLMSLVQKKEEGIAIEGDNEKEYDEHVWTSLKNTKKIIEKIENEIEKIDPQNRELYIKNRDEYIEKINEIDQNITDIVQNSKRNELIFADRFPFKYFTDDYNLKYYAAFKGCAEETEASAKTIKILIDKVKKNNVPVVLKIEMSNSLLAHQIREETGVKIMTFNSAQNISKEDYNNQMTYIDIMNNNVEVLKEALN